MTRVLSALLLLGALGRPVAGQSIFNAAGLGVPIEALDGRARAMGNFGIGLRGAAFMPTDPAAAARLSVSTGIMVGQPSWTDYSADPDVAGSFRSSRFPLFGVAYPVFSGMASVQIGSYLDQHYTKSSEGTVDIGAGPIGSLDTFVQDGSVSTLNLGYARMLTPDVAVGVSLARYAGSVDRTLTRSFDDTTGDVDQYVTISTWEYRGHALTLGTSADVGTSFRVAASLQLPTDLEARPQESTTGSARTFDLPVQLRVGGSAMFGPGVIATASYVTADWSKMTDDLIGTDVAHGTNGFGLGIELSRSRLWGKDAPLRVGLRQNSLPFSFDYESVTERTVSVGMGLVLNTTNDVDLAGLDLALERGRRSGTGLSESFWRATISLRAAGF